MALIIWIPFVNGIQNQGLANVETSTIGTISYQPGKIGQAVKIGRGTQVGNGVSINSNLIQELGEEYSCAVWVRPDGNHVHYEGAIISSGNWNGQRWAFGLNQNNTKVDVFGRDYQRYVDCACPVGEWTHLVSTYKNKVMYLYKNGEYVGSYTGQTYNNSTNYLTSDATNTTIGRETYGGGYFSFNGCIQDLRLYNHCLDADEVRRVSRGLTIHYPLSKESTGTENLIINSANIKASHLTSGNEYIALDVGQSYMDVDSGTWVTISFDLEMKISTPAGSFMVYNANNKGPKQITANGTVANQIYPGTSVGDVVKKRIYYEGIINDRDPSTVNQTKNFIEFYSNYGSGNVFAVSNLKMELGRKGKATPWSPNPADTIYSAMNFNSNVVRDLSGYGYDGIKNNITYSDDTPRNMVSSELNSASPSWVRIDTSNWMIQKSPEFTWSIWAYHTNWASVTRLISCTESGGFNVEPGDSGCLRFRIHCYTNSGQTTTGYVDSNQGIRLSELTSGWHMLTFVYTTSSYKGYIDGELHSNRDVTTYGIHFPTSVAFQ